MYLLSHESALKIKLHLTNFIYIELLTIANAKETISIDHHGTNTMFADCNFVIHTHQANASIVSALGYYINSLTE